MKLGVLYSGGKDSTLALIKAQQHHEVACLISIISENKESFMFHTPNIDMTLLQSQALGIPLVRVTTKGEKEKELEDLKKRLMKQLSGIRLKELLRVQSKALIRQAECKESATNWESGALIHCG